MIITIKPSDIIKRCLWYEYKNYCLSELTEDEIQKLVENDESVILTENDAFFIGLLKVIETDNLIHRFNQYIEDFLKIRSVIKNGKLYVYKNILIKEVLQFKERFPEYYKPTFGYKKGLEDLILYIDDIYNKIQEIEEFTLSINEKDIVCYHSNDIKKILEIK